eukprot:m.255198 g.255198  ORF g.255198 m.255198 type:complete len:911 (+) comp19611_c0_seq2:217-2949(+)
MDKFPGWDFPFCHGVINRAEAERRLLKFNQIGAYLIRCKDKSGVEFVYSYLDAPGEVQHARIEIKGRSYVVDGRKYTCDGSGVDLFDIVETCSAMHEEAGAKQGSGLARPREIKVPVIKSGHLCKRAIGKSMFFGRDNWKERWFVLDANNLTYYSKPINGSKKGKVPVKQLCGVESCIAASGKPFVFCIMFKHYTMYVQAHSETDRNDWVRQLTVIIRNVRGEHSGIASIPEICASTATKEDAIFGLSAPWYFPDYDRVMIDRIMARAVPGDYIGRNSSDGTKIVIVVKDEYFALRYFNIRPLATGNIEISSGVEVPSLEHAITEFLRCAPSGAGGRPIFLKKMVDPALFSSSEGSAIVTNSEITSAANVADPSLWDNRDETDTGDDLQLHISPLNEFLFNDLSTNDTMPEELPQYARGRRWNRYWDILPNPLTRVRLDILNDDPETEYINANFIRGYGDRSPREYIAAQAPEEKTVGTFLRMIFEKEVDIIVCLTNLVDGDRCKCFQYWPDTDDTPVTSGGYTMALIHVEYGPGLKKFHLEISDGDTVRKLRLYWLTSWPDHGVPTNAKGEMDPGCILGLVRDVRQMRKRQRRANPILVHCSAGIGRTGAFIVIDHAINALQARETVNVIDIISTIRQDRMGMVQSTSQYKFIYQACLTYARTRFANSTVLTKCATSRDSVTSSELDSLIASRMHEDSLKKNGTWKVHDLSADFAVFSLRDNPAGLRVEKTDKMLIAENDEDPPQMGSSRGANSPAVRRKLATKPLHKQPWFRSDVTRQQVDELLSDTFHGMFIVRPSSKKGLYALSVQGGNLTYDDASQIVNMLLLPATENGKSGFKLGQFGTEFFSTIPELVEYFTKNPYAEDEASKQQKYLRFYGAGGNTMKQLGAAVGMTLAQMPTRKQKQASMA